MRAIAIDGPSGAGKSTVAREVAKKLGFIYVDTGAMYRAAAFYMLENSIDISNISEVVKALTLVDVEIKYIETFQNIYLNGRNITNLIRTQEVSNTTSKLSTIKEVRDKMTDLSRIIATNNNVVMDGRDIGMVVLPNADLKIFLSASSTVRAKRRVIDLEKIGQNPDYDTILKEIEERDYRDSNRDESPLKLTDESILIDTSDMKLGEVVEKIINLLGA